MADRSLTARSTYWRVLSLVLLCAVAGFGSIILSRRPSNDRAWAVDHARLPEIVFADSLVRIANVRDFRHLTGDSSIPRYATKTYDLSRVETVWLVLAPFAARWRGPAHVFVSFGFADSSYLAISIEARREIGEEYGLLRGLGRNFEIIYVIGEERDLIGKRAVAAEGDLYLYPVRTPPARARAVLLDILRRAEQLRVVPEFYNTITNSCSSNLVRHVNRVVPGRIPIGLELLAPGYADDVARSLGLLDSTATVEQLRARYRITEAARRFLDQPDFSRLIRARPPASPRPAPSG